MIAQKESAFTIRPEVLEAKALWLEQSMAPHLIEQFFDESKGQGGRSCAGAFSILGYLAVKAALLAIPRAPSDAEAFRVMQQLTDAQLVRLGMTPAVRTATYGAFAGWIARRLAPLDPGFDLPARRVTNADHRRHIAARTPETQDAVELAAYRLHTVVNLIVAASVDERQPAGICGDMVVDESVVDLAGPSAGLGSRDDKHRAAAYAGAYYVRDRTDNSINTNGEVVRSVKKVGFGIGVTAVTRVGSPDDLYGVPPVITGIAIHQPTSASVEGMTRALQAHADNGFAPARGPRMRLPYLTVDMGYNQKQHFNDACVELGYSPVVRYPRSWRTLWASSGREHCVRGVPAGPVQISGDFYCPCAASLSRGMPLVRKTDDMRDADGFDQQDRRLERLLPLLMGTNSRPYRARAQGRPRKDADPDTGSMRIDLVCPAVQGRVRCPLKPASMMADPSVVTVQPSWGPEAYRCCSQSQVTVTYSKDQWRMATWGLTPGSWEHTVYFEAARALTEQRFSILKSPHITGFSDLRWSARREPAIALLIALWVGTANRSIQDSHAARRQRGRSSIARRFRMIEEDLGRPPVRLPART